MYLYNILQQKYTSLPTFAVGKFSRHCKDQIFRGQKPKIIPLILTTMNNKTASSRKNTKTTGFFFSTNTNK